MSTNDMTFRIFISSPGDLGRQRQIAKDTIRTISATYERRGIRIIPWAWEDDAVSEMGSSAQDVINRQLGKYDIYLGLMGARFGSPSGAYGAGTEREFFEALELKVAGTILGAGFFFRNVNIPVGSLNDEDLGQIQSVVRFRREVGVRGLFFEFSEDHQLTLLVQKFVSALIDEAISSIVPVAHQYSWTSETSTKSPIVSPQFYGETLNSLDADFRSGSRGMLSLEDLWVPPELRTTTAEEADNAPNGTPYEFESLVRELETGSTTLVFGPEKSGKTCICRRTHLALAENGFLPVMLNAERVNTTDLGRLAQRIRATYPEQYENLAPSDLDKLDQSRIILIIDDFDQVRLTPTRAFDLLISLRKICHSVLVSAPPQFQASFLTALPSTNASDFPHRIEVRPLGHRKQYALVEKWCSAGQNVSGEDDLRSMVDRRRRVLDSILRGNLVPRNPMVILVLLQAIEANQADGLARSGYVRYYKFLIDSVLLRNLSADEAELSYELLPQLAWAVYRSQESALPAEVAERIVDEFAERQALRKTILYSVLGKLRLLGIFEDRSAALRFRKKYVYYFFLAIT